MLCFSELYNQKKKVYSFEFFPPKQESDLRSTKDLIGRMSELSPDFMTVTYGAGGGTRARTSELTSYIVNELHCPAAAHITCVYHTIPEIDSILDELAKSGVKHVVALRGDPSHSRPANEVLFPGFDCARDLTKHIKNRGDFCIAVAGYPETHPTAASREADLVYLAEKVACGAEIVITQLFFDPDFYFSFVEEARRAGVDVPIVPGVLPITTARQLDSLTEKCGASIPESLRRDLDRLGEDAAAVAEFGLKHAVDLCEKLMAGGAPGIHFYTLNKSSQVEGVLRVLKARFP